MRLNNRNKAVYYNFISISILMLLVLAIVVFLMDYFIYDLFEWNAIVLLILPIILLIIFYVRGKQIFEYDSDGEALHVKNSDVVTFLHKPLNDEFPKYKLLKYEVIDAFLFKRLFLTISSKRNNSLILKYDISYISRKEVKDLKISLNKIVKFNAEHKRDLIN